MRSLVLSSTLCLTALTLATLPAQAQFIAIPVTNGNFAITKSMAGVSSYSVLPTFLSPAGTLTITGATTTATFYSSPTLVTTNTPVGFADNGSFSGSATLTDGRTATFTGAGAALRGTATITGAASMPATPAATLFGITSFLPNGATFTYTVQSGAVNIPAASFSAYSPPQFTIPISGGSFTLTDPTGLGNSTIVLNSVLTPLGTTNLTLNLPNLVPASRFPFPSYAASALQVTLNGVANGTVALSDGRTADVTDRLITLNARTQVVPLPPVTIYVQGSSILAAPVTIQGTITGGSISVPDSAVSPFPTVPVQPPAVVQPPEPQFILGAAQTLNLGGEPLEYLKLVEQERPVAPEDLPDVEASPLAFSRIHPGVNAYTR